MFEDPGCTEVSPCGASNSGVDFKSSRLLSSPKTTGNGSRDANGQATPEVKKRLEQLEEECYLRNMELTMQDQRMQEMYSNNVELTLHIDRQEEWIRQLAARLEEYEAERRWGGCTTVFSRCTIM
mmetsp:Transcript_49187/g.117121  ORF Transcript_49187/g.117121 Transcript_49187/m.117121 type:complete len:125 (-) Transcript_49187:45-419(-)